MAAVYPGQMSEPANPPVPDSSSYGAATAALIVAAVLLMFSFWLPYWENTMFAPQQPQGTRFPSYLNDVPGPPSLALASATALDPATLREIDRLERSLGIGLMTVVFLLVLTAFLVRRPWLILLTIPALCFPLIVVADRARCLYFVIEELSTKTGLRLDPSSHSLFGRVELGPIVLETYPGIGLMLAAAASIAVAVGIWLRFKGRRSGHDTLGPSFRDQA